ncbi:DUF1918 domain-containing protein [Marinactinospora thermotolerans]|uniref:DUF1918 domain-containing protein n=1 Tax=Marinactinospora thermotolerans DSM 45154 TaxID=1122192 RepID=A0A1T4NDA8_9ACTN|nr:DUF1918 domain-containing protein [Marinactinospora thermotolerans]SJZ77331.1 protein of unknown function [Marinactinospora thermotolerans DSM 45154]
MGARLGRAVATTIGAAVLATAGAQPASAGDVGDTIHCASFLGGQTRSGEIVAVRGEGGAPPYLVEWEDGRETILTDDDNCIVRAAPPEQAPVQPAPAEEAATV